MAYKFNSNRRHIPNLHDINAKLAATGTEFDGKKFTYTQQADGHYRAEINQSDFGPDAPQTITLKGKSKNLTFRLEGNIWMRPARIAVGLRYIPTGDDLISEVLVWTEG